MSERARDSTIGSRRSGALPQYEAAQDLEARLGAPQGPDSVFTFDHALRLDELEAFPFAGIDRLNALGYALHYIPERLGGRLRCFEECLAAIRMVARRDPTLCLSHGQTFLGSMPIWIGGDDGLQRRLATLLASGAKVPLALTERAHGTDITANETTARRVPDGYEVSGEKWLINLGTQSHALTLHVRTSDAKGPRSHSLLLVEKAELKPERFSHLPRVRTLGMRGADISGIRFDRSIVPARAIVGHEGDGFGTLLKTLQISRTLVVALSLGAADTGLRLVVDFARNRRLYGKTVFELPEARHSIVGAFIDLLCCECASVAAARALTLVPEQFSVWSAVIKYWVPTAVERLLQQLAIVLGARHYLREPVEFGFFQKLLRDNGVVGLFDGSTVANLSAIATQLRVLARAPGAIGDRELPDKLHAIFALSARAPSFDGAGYDISNRGRDDVLAGVALSVARLADATGVDSRIRAAVVRWGRVLEEQIHNLRRRVTDVAAAYGADSARQPESFACARRYARLHVAAACLHVFAHSRSAFDDFGGRGTWAVACLARLLGGPLWQAQDRDRGIEDELASRLLELTDTQRLYSLTPLQLAEGLARERSEAS